MLKELRSSTDGHHEYIMNCETKQVHLHNPLSLSLFLSPCVRACVRACVRVCVCVQTNFSCSNTTSTEYKIRQLPKDNASQICILNCFVNCVNP